MRLACSWQVNRNSIAVFVLVATSSGSLLEALHAPGTIWMPKYTLSTAKPDGLQYQLPRPRLGGAGVGERWT